MEAAAQLFIHAAPELFRRSKNNHTATGAIAKDYNDRSSKSGKQTLWTGRGGYSLERWAFWKERWEVLSNMKELSESERQAARVAIEAMDETE